MVAKSLLAFVALSSVAVAQNLLTNPGFDENGDAEAPIGWLPNGDMVDDFTTTTSFQSPSVSFGFQYSSSPGGPHTLSQNVAGSTLGNCYEISFYTGIESDGSVNNVDQTLTVTFGDGTYDVDFTGYPLIVENQADGSAGNYVFNSFTATATDDDDLLTFTANPDTFIQLDTVSVSLSSTGACPVVGPSQGVRTRRNRRHAHKAQW